MNKHSLKLLEFDKVKEIISRDVYIEKTSEKLMNLSPSTDYNYIKNEFEILQEFIEMSKFDVRLELNGIKDMSEYLEEISLIGTFLGPDMLYNIKENLRIFRKSQNKFEDLKSKYKKLNTRFESIQTYKEIEEAIDKIVNEEREIKDNATLDLKKIRKNKILINQSIQKKFDEIMSKSSNEKMIQEKIVTIRDGRKVLPIKADFKGQFKGIEHDRSSSGVTIFIEPLSVVSLNNKIRELEAREREEIRKILLRMSDVIRNNSEGLLVINENILELDFMNAKMLYAVNNKCIVPKLSRKKYFKLVEAKHPLIAEDEVVPLSFEIGSHYDAMLITGPNTGGKTVSLKTAGLLTAMTQAIIPIPANENTEMGIFSGIFADIGDEQSIEQSLSSFSSHLTNINKIVNEIDKDSLVLLDELGSGTDPIEGAAFAMSVIDYLREKQSKSIITTHYSEVKAYSYNEEGIQSASMEFDVETLSPTYRLLIGIPGKSNALTIARKLGMSEKIIDRAESYISEEDKKVEDMIKNIQDKSEEIDRDKLRVREMEEEIKKIKKDYELKMQNLEEEKEAIIAKAYQEAEDLVKNMQNKAKALVDKIQKEDFKKSEVKETQKSLNMLQRAITEEKAEKVKVKKKKRVKLDIKKGDKVFIKSLNGKADVLKVDENRGEIQVQAGILKLMVDMSEVQKIEEVKSKKSYASHTIKNRKRVKSEIDLRGMSTEEAIYEIDLYLDNAVLSGYKDIYLIHGKGTGVLRKNIQKYLKKNRYVESYRIGNGNEGGLGATVVTLKG